MVEAELEARKIRMTTPAIQGDSTMKTRSTHAKVCNLAKRALKEATATLMLKKTKRQLDTAIDLRVKDMVALDEARCEIKGLKEKLALKDKARQKEVADMLARKRAEISRLRKRQFLMPKDEVADISLCGKFMTMISDKKQG